MSEPMFPPKRIAHLPTATGQYRLQRADDIHRATLDAHRAVDRATGLVVRHMSKVATRSPHIPEYVKDDHAMRVGKALSEAGEACARLRLLAGPGDLDDTTNPVHLSLVVLALEDIFLAQGRLQGTLSHNPAPPEEDDDADTVA